MTSPRPVSKRAARWFAAGCLVLAVAALGIALWSSHPVEVTTPVSTAAAVKLLVADEGPVAVKPAMLGWSSSDLNSVHVKLQGAEQPTWIKDGTLYFYAPISRTSLMTETVFWLERSVKASPQMPEVTNASNVALRPIDHYTATLHLEENHVYAPQVEDGDHWFWAQLPAPITKTIPFTVTDLVDAPAHLTIEAWANTEAPVNPDHAYRLFVNDQPLGDYSWDGQGTNRIEADVPPGALREGVNTLTLSAPGVKDVTADITFLNWIELHYARAFKAQADRLTFDSPGGVHHLSGFSGPVTVFDITRPDQTTRTTLDAEASFVGEAGHRYWAVGPQGYQTGRVEAARLAPDLRAATNAAAYIAIGPNDLLDAVQPLLAWHTAHGLSTMAVPVQAIYDQFGDGQTKAEAIRSFLQYAATQWATHPQYALLVGDASYDPLGYTAPPQANRLPTFFVQTIFGGQTASDVGFAQLTDDLKPDIAVGRLPAREADQVRTWVTKTLAYLQQPPAGDWRRRVVAVADGQEPTFSADAQYFLDQFAGAFQTTLVNPPAGIAGASADIVRDIDEGSAIVSYFGHGSVTQWGKDNLFTMQDVAALQNDGKLPLVINMTCLTGLFTHPTVQSLTETLLWKPAGGAVAVLAPTSLTLSTDQSFLSQALVRAFMKDRSARLGDVFLQAQRSIPNTDAGSQDVLRTFLLFGDPALRLVQPNE